MYSLVWNLHRNIVLCDSAIMSLLRNNVQSVSAMQMNIYIGKARVNILLNVRDEIPTGAPKQIKQKNKNFFKFEMT